MLSPCVLVEPKNFALLLLTYGMLTSFLEDLATALLTFILPCLQSHPYLGTSPEAPGLAYPTTLSSNR